MKLFFLFYQNASSNVKKKKRRKNPDDVGKGLVVILDVEVIDFLFKAKTQVSSELMDLPNKIEVQLAKY